MQSAPRRHVWRWGVVDGRGFKMSTRLGGTETGYVDSLEFVNPVPPELEIYCSICLDVLNEPHLTQCCGHHFCLSCLNAVKKERKPCPLCKDPHIKAVLNKGLKRTINGLKVYCLHKSKGCPWSGELKELPVHTQEGSRDGDCAYVLVKCINECGELLERSFMKKHEDEMCTKRPSSNPLDLARRLQALSTENESLKETVTQLKKANIGNEQVIAQLQRQMKSCLTDVAVLKQQMLAMAQNDIPQLVTLNTHYSNPLSPIDVTPEASTGGKRLVPYEFVFDNYARRCQNPELWFCAPFYTHNNGYKMCVRVAPQGLGNGEGTHVSVHSYLMKGEHDDMLVWPFRGAITIQLLNQLKDECHHEQMTDFNDRTPEQYCRR